MAQPNPDAFQANLTQPMSRTAIDTDSQMVENELPNSIKDLALPQSAADGLIKKPFAQPLDLVVPTARPKLTGDQERKYHALLERISTWSKIPTKQAKGSTELPLSDSERMFLTRDCLQRYLRATTWNVVQAETRLKATLVWRRDYGVEELTAEYIGIENETGKQLILGYDIAARPCHYMNPSKQNTPRTDRQIEHLVYMLEREVDLMVPGQETLALLINFADTKSGQGASIGQGKQTLNILQNHYPERLGRALVTNIPFYISGFFKLITPFIDPNTRQKLKFNEDMSQHVPRAQLLKANGGDVEFEYDHSVYWPTFNKLAAIRRAEYQARWEKGGKRFGEYEDYLRGGPFQSLAERESGIAAAKATPEIANEKGSLDEAPFRDAVEVQ